MKLSLPFIGIILSLITLSGCIRVDYDDYPRSKTYYIHPTSYDRGYHSESLRDDRHHYYVSKNGYHSDTE